MKVTHFGTFIVFLVLSHTIIFIRQLENSKAWNSEICSLTFKALLWDMSWYVFEIISSLSQKFLQIHDTKIIFFKDLYASKNFMFYSKVYVISLRQPKDNGNILQNFIFRTLSDYLLNTFHPCHTLKHQS